MLQSGELDFPRKVPGPNRAALLDMVETRNELSLVCRVPIVARLDTDGWVRVRSKRLFYRRFGLGAKKTILALHGGPGLSHDYLTPLADLVGAGYEVVLYDQLGCGRSERPSDYHDYTLRANADDVDELRRRLKLGRVHLFGHSYGGALALEAALRHPAGLRSLVVSGGFASVDTLWRGLRLRVNQLSKLSRDAALREDRTGVSTKAGQRADEEFRRRFSEHLVNRPYELIATFRKASRPIHMATGIIQPHLIEHGYRSGTLAGWDVVPKLPRLRMPVLITVGEFDHVVPACAREIHRGIPGSRLEIRRGEGHLPFFESRDAYVSLLREFFDRHG